MGVWLWSRFYVEPFRLSCEKLKIITDSLGRKGIGFEPTKDTHPRQCCFFGHNRNHEEIHIPIEKIIEVVGNSGETDVQFRLYHNNINYSIYFESEKYKGFCDTVGFGSSHRFIKDEEEKAAENYLYIGKVFYGIFRPLYGWVDCDSLGEEPERGHVEAGVYMRSTRYWPALWGNFFGPYLVKKFGKEFLLNAPSLRTEELDDGGILLILGPSIYDYYPKAREFEAYFQQISVERRSALEL